MNVVTYIFSYLIFIYGSFCTIIDNEIDEITTGENCILSDKLRKEIQSYKPTVERIIDNIVNGKFSGDTYKSLANMTDKFGARFTGTDNLEKAIDYMVIELKNAGLENVHTENAEVKRWVRGYEAATMISPRKENLAMLGLGYSVGTPRGGIMGDVVVVESFEELSSLPNDTTKGKIIVFTPKWLSYGKTVKYRSKGASEASKKGAIAALIRSITPFSIGTPHTGMQTYENGVNKIPAACITVEDAEMLLRMYRNGEKIQIRLEMEARNLEPGISRNTIGELQGTVHINESVVVLSGHLDSWDVGVGAMDDGGGAFISWKALEYLKKSNFRPKRTLRAILWTGEELGILGAKAYQLNHSKIEKEEFNFFMESDIGTFDPLGLDFSGNKDAECIFKEILKLMKALNATQFESPIDGGPDISQWVNRGFPGASLLNKNEKYFWFHHSAGDSMLVENSKSLDKCTALFAAVAYVIADLSVNMTRY